MIIDKEFSKCIKSYDCYSERLISVSFETIYGILTIFQIYAPDSSYSDELSDEFYDDLQTKINKLSRSNSNMIIGDFNAKVGGDQHDNWPNVSGKYGLGNSNEELS